MEVRMPFKWSNNLATGIEKVDQQHKQLIETVNSLLEAVKNGEPKDKVDETIEFLSDYVITHFKTEEEVMIKHQYPEYEKHKDIHENFVKDFKELLKKRNELSFTFKLQTKVGEWLINHIHNVDKKMAKYIRNNQT
jgi:hemerythrin